VASLPGAALEHLVDPASFSEIAANSEQKSATEEKQEEHFIHYRNRIQAATQPAAPANPEPPARTAISTEKEVSFDGTLVTEHTALYLRHRSLLI
jgi:hypothetical protein